MRTVVWSMLAVIALGLGLAPADGAEGPAIAIIDLKKVYDNHPRFQQEYEAMKKEVQNAESDIKMKQEAINKRILVLRTLDPGSQEYKNQDDAITADKAQLSVLITQHKKEFARKEAKIYHKAYQEIMYEVEPFCRKYEIDLVLRFNSDLMAETGEVSSDPNMVARQLNKPVVYANPRIDLTKTIIDTIKARYPGVSTRPIGPGTINR
ncbi:MAG: OmpH family outer membrane protein [Planctomycetia bacterium]|nr:OmpH family outer membrane protein [Planctomycetia bacterium]